jgi:hypothetical protein
VIADVQPGDAIAAHHVKRNQVIRHAETVERFAARLWELRFIPYIWRLESGGGTPGIDLMERLAEALGTTVHDLLPATAATNPGRYSASGPEVVRGAA